MAEALGCRWGTTREFVTKGWVRHRGAGITLAYCPEGSVSEPLAGRGGEGRGGASTCPLPTSYSVKLISLRCSGERQNTRKAAEQILSS